jgi:DNA-binding NtrC family response regulator
MASSRHAPEPMLLCDGSDPSQVLFEAASPAMRSFNRMLEHAAQNDAPVLLVGETGAGKSTFARVLHAMSSRATRPFVRVDCPAALGDFSGETRAVRDGTLFLDEVAELSPPMQAAALRFRQDPRPPPFCLVASTRHDLQVEVAAGRFRKDLFYHLDVLEIRIPPLRERADDILPIARGFVASLAQSEGRACPQLSPDLERALLAYTWPGNLQELFSVLQRLLILSTGGSLDVGSLPDRFAAG